MLPGRRMSWSVFLQAVRSALNNPDAHFFADTSFLTSAGSLHPSARRALEGWIGAIGRERFHIPTWAAQEVYRLLGRDNGIALTPMGKLANEVTAKLDELRVEARRFVDDPAAAGFQAAPPGPRDRAGFLVGLDGEVGRLATRARHLKQVAGERLDDTSEFLARIINSHLLTGGVYDALPTIEAEYQARLIGDHPPGQKDRGKDSNRYGDLLIWREIVESCHAAVPPYGCVILLSNDNKPDWVYRPPSMIDDAPGVGTGRTMPNNGRHGFQIILPQPLLVHELGRGRVDFQLHIVNLPMLARLTVDRAELADLAHAYSAIVPEAAPPADGDATEPPTDTEEVEPPPAAPPVASLEAQRAALADIDRSAEAAAALRTTIGRGMTPQEARATGRAIVEAAEGGREAAELLGRALLANEDELADDLWSALFEGMLLGTYFTADGRRRRRPLRSLQAGVFVAAVRNEAREAVSRLKSEIGSGSRDYLLLPGDEEPVNLTATVRRRATGAAKLEAVTRGETSLLVDGRRGAPNSLVVLADGLVEDQVAAFRRLLAHHFAVPESAVGLNLALADMVSWDELQCLVDWGTDTGVRLR